MIFYHAVTVPVTHTAAVQPDDSLCNSRSILSPKSLLLSHYQLLTEFLYCVLNSRDLYLLA